MEKVEQEFLWVEKYRPKTVAECVLPDEQKAMFEEFLNKQEIQNMLLCGSAGVGKTTIAKALCLELGADYLVINGSEESGIDVLRTKIKSFASSMSFSGKTKVVILDEADFLNPNSTQPALRAFIEEFSANCRFIFTCNYKNRIIPALHSRCAVIEFKIKNSDKPKIAAAFFKRVLQILEAEKITYSDKVVAKVVEKYFPDFRRVLNELQRYSASGNIDEGILSLVSDTNMNDLVSSLQAKDWKKMRSWVVQNSDIEPGSIFRKLYDTLVDKVVNVPELVILLADYSYKSAFCADQEINVVACLTECMAVCEFKK